FQAEDGIRDFHVTGVQTCALPICAVCTARLAFLRHRQVGVTVAGPLQVALRERDATVSFEVALTGGSGGLLPEAARLYSVETGWRLEDGDWRLLSASWEPRL